MPDDLPLPYDEMQTDFVPLERALRWLPDAQTITLLAQGLGLDAEQTAVFRGRITDTTIVGTPGVAAVFGYQDQSIRKWRKERRASLAAGRTLGPGDFLPALAGPDAEESPQYLTGLINLWGMQTERLHLDGTVNTRRKLPGRAAGRQAPRVREPEIDYAPMRQQVVDAYRAARREGLTDRQARVRVAEATGLTRRVVARRLIEVTERPQEYGVLWAERPGKPLAKAS